MRVALLELPARFGAPAEQLAVARRLLLDGPRPELALLPEASLTGYVSDERAVGDPFDLKRFAEERGGPTEGALAALAAEVGTALVGPVIEREGERCFNALVGVAGDGVFLRYRKRHPWYPEVWATAGERPLPVVERCGRKLTAAICFDVHFLEAESAPQLEAAELLLFASAWVEEHDSRVELLGGLARRAGVVVANANWGRGRPLVPGQGGSCFYDRAGHPCGEVVATARLGGEEARRLDLVLP